MKKKCPRKKDYIQRAHANPYKHRDIYIPFSPKTIDWSQFFKVNKQPKFLDLGCGYGKFLFHLARENPEVNVLGMEIRYKVAEYVKEKIKFMELSNAAAICTNGMLFILNFFAKESLEKIFILYPDPHFKKKKQKARILSKQMVPVYEFLLKLSGRIYISTDVEELFNEMHGNLIENINFKEVEHDVYQNDIAEETDEALRAGAMAEKKFHAVFEKRKSQ